MNLIIKNSVYLRVIAYIMTALTLNLIAVSCTQENEAVTKPEATNGSIKIDYGAINQYIDHNVDIEKGVFSEDFANQMIKDLGGAEKVGMNYNDVLAMKDKMVDYLTTEVNESARTNATMQKEDVPKKISEIILAGLNDASSYSDFEKNVIEAKKYAGTLADADMKAIALGQIEQSVTLTNDFIAKYGMESTDINARSKFGCKWYQWACVGVATAAAVALIATTPVGIAAFIIGGGTVAAVAACCICKCRCEFTTTTGCRNA